MLHMKQAIISKDELLLNELETDSAKANESHVSKKLRIADFKRLFIVQISGYILAFITLFIGITKKCCFSNKIVILCLVKYPLSTRKITHWKQRTLIRRLWLLFL